MLVRTGFENRPKCPDQQPRNKTNSTFMWAGMLEKANSKVTGGHMTQVLVQVRDTFGLMETGDKFQLSRGWGQAPASQGFTRLSAYEGARGEPKNEQISQADGPARYIGEMIDRKASGAPVAPEGALAPGFGGEGKQDYFQNPLGKKQRGL